MKLLMLGWELPPHNSGGLGVACYQMAKALAGQGVDIKFVLPYRADHPKAEQFMQVIPATEEAPMVDEHGDYVAMGAYSGNCIWCHGSRTCRHAKAYGKGFVAATHQYADRCEALAKQHKLDADVIHAHDWLTMEAGVRVKAVTGKPLVVHIHATEFDRAGGHRGNPLIHDIECYSLQIADRIFAVSQITKDIICREYGIPASKVEVMHNALDPAELSRTTVMSNNYTYIRKMQEMGYTTVVSIGRLTVQKGLAYLMQAAVLAISKNPKLLFVISGSGEQRDQLISMAADLGISDRVIFTGFVRGVQFRELYELADMFVMPSVSEPFGITALEAAFYDTALLLSRTSGAGEVLRSIMRFDYWDTRKLADQIVGISLSDALKSELVEGVKREYLSYDWGDVARHITSQYVKLIKAKRPRRKGKEVEYV